MNKKVTQEDWYRKTVEILKQYRPWKTRLNILDIRINEATPNCIANYEMAATGEGQHSDQTGNIGTKRAEWEKEKLQLLNSIKEIDLVLEMIDDTEREIIKLRYIDGTKDWQIHNIHLPMGTDRYYRLRDSGLKKVAESLRVKQE